MVNILNLYLHFASHGHNPEGELLPEKDFCLPASHSSPLASGLLAQPNSSRKAEKVCMVAILDFIAG